MISVIIPVYNGFACLAAALRSVIAQSLPPSEVIVVDDGSTDGSADLAAAFGPPVRILRRTHQGGGAALNAGIAESTGEFLAFLDADDLWVKDKLARQRAALKSDAFIDAVLGQVVQFVDMDCRISKPGEITRMSEPMIGLHKIAMLIRRATFYRVGSFDESMVADFPEWYVRAVRTGIRVKTLDHVVAFRRIHRNNMTRSRRDALHRDYLRIARKALSEKASRIRDRG